MGRQNADFGITDDELKALAEQLEKTEKQVKRAIIETVNDTADEVQVTAAREIARRVNLKPPYIAKHLKVSQRAIGSRSEAIISATKRGVLLSRFDANQEYRNSRDNRGRSGSRVRGGVSVRVSATGGRHTMESGFLIKLRGSGAMGLAVRPKDKSKLNKKEWREVGKRGYLVLHGPSVDQLFRSQIDKDGLEPTLDEMAARLLEKLYNV